MDRSNLFQNALSMLLVASAVAMAAVVVHREFMTPEGDAPVAVSGWEPLARRVPDLGQSPVGSRIVLFSDYQCPYCKDLDSKLATLVGKHPGKLSVVRYEFPLTRIHAQAYASAVAAKCAARQGVRQAFQRALFSNDLGQAGGNFATLAESARVPDLVAFDRCVGGRESRAAVDADIAQAKHLGIESVPAFIVDGMLYTGTRDMDELEALLVPVL